MELPWSHLTVPSTFQATQGKILEITIPSLLILKKSLVQKVHWKREILEHSLPPPTFTLFATRWLGHYAAYSIQIGTRLQGRIYGGRMGNFTNLKKIFIINLLIQVKVCRSITILEVNYFPLLIQILGCF